MKLKKTERLHHKLTDLINEFGNVAGYKINAKKSMEFLYTNSELTETGTKKAIPFTITPKKLRHLGINLTEEVKDLTVENYRTLRKQIEEDINRWKNIACSTSLKCPYYQKQSTDLMQFPLKYQWHISQT